MSTHFIQIGRREQLKWKKYEYHFLVSNFPRQMKHISSHNTRIIQKSL